ncbi:MAG TPA: WD40 repeat domain-containing protein [Thermoanaerobaculia bacterium]|nr:WD40 repeat domain-containing protein [Thermoanaerobaculia bacterium]
MTRRSGCPPPPGIYEKAKSFEERVAELFSLQGYRTTVDYKRDDMQFDVRLELTVLLAGHSGPINSVAWSPDGQCVATGSDDRTVKVWDAGSGKVLQTLKW